MEFPGAGDWSIQVLADYKSASRVAADILYDEIKSDPRLLLCAATGSSPIGTYKALNARLLGDVDSSRSIRILKLDEWGGLLPNDPSSCEFHLHDRLIRPLDLHPSQCVGFQPDTLDAEKECTRIESWLAANGPIDVCVLGLGTNGHIGFNEPADELDPRSHVAQLSDESMSHSMLDGVKTRPTFGMTVGMQAILASRMILLLVFGEATAAQLNRLLTGEVSTQFPASFLTQHRNVTCVCDKAAMSHFGRDR